MYRMKLRQGKTAINQDSRKRFRFRARRHDPWLVLNMSIFNFAGGWNRIFNPFLSRQNARST
jgi:hypothetical protein